MSCSDSRRRPWARCSNVAGSPKSSARRNDDGCTTTGPAACIGGNLCFSFLYMVLVMLAPEAFGQSSAGIARAESPIIKVQYPKKNQAIPAVDSTFILGMVTPGSELEINGLSIPVHEQGGFLAYVDVDPGEFNFILRASLQGDTVVLNWPVDIADSYRAVPGDSLALLSSHQSPTVYQELIRGDPIEVAFRGTPGGIASFSIDGVVADHPMTESGPSYWTVRSSEVFGSGTIEDSGIVPGSYRGSIYIPDSSRIDSALVTFRLKVPVGRVNRATADAGAKKLIDGRGQFYVLEDTAEGRVTVLHHEYPQILELIDSVQTLRTGPKKGYLSIFQPRGVRFVYEGRYADYLKLRLAPGQTAWVPDTSVVFLPPGTPIPHSYIRSVRCTGMDDKVRVQVFLDEKLPFQVDELTGSDQFILRIFQATSDTDWIRYAGSREHIDGITWSQEQVGVYRLTIVLKNMFAWGWNCYYEGNTLTLDIMPAPERFRSYKDLRVMIDAGHSADPGAIGPTGLTEAEANMMIADRLAATLRKKGATVFMTRVDDSDVKLYDRPRKTVEKSCEIFVSIHNNAVPDGVNPFYANGTSTYYYNTHSRPLADFVQAKLVENLGLSDHGVYYANFAVTRPTQYVAILVECAFMIIPEQEAALRTEAFQTKCAEAIADGLDDYLRSLDED